MSLYQVQRRNIVKAPSNPGNKENQSFPINQEPTPQGHQAKGKSYGNISGLFPENSRGRPLQIEKKFTLGQGSLLGQKNQPRFDRSKRFSCGGDCVSLNPSAPDLQNPTEKDITQKDLSLPIEPQKGAHHQSLRDVTNLGRHSDVYIPSHQTKKFLNSKGELLQDKESYKAKESKRLIAEYSSDILRTYKAKATKDVPKAFLNSHSISPALRGKMVDWMIEVLTSYKCNDQTFFMAVSLMDFFLNKTSKSLSGNDLHVLGVTCMFLAAKYEEVYPMKLRVVQEKIAHKKISLQAIQEMEQDILSTLNFAVTGSSMHEIGFMVLKQLDLNELLDEEQLKHLERFMVHVMKMIAIDYDLSSTKNPLDLGLAAIFLVLQTLGKSNSRLRHQEKVKRTRFRLFDWKCWETEDRSDSNCLGNQRRRVHRDSGEGDQPRQELREQVLGAGKH